LSCALAVAVQWSAVQGVLDRRGAAPGTPRVSAVGLTGAVLNRTAAIVVLIAIGLVIASRVEESPRMNAVTTDLLARLPHPSRALPDVDHRVVVEGHCVRLPFAGEAECWSVPKDLERCVALPMDMELCASAHATALGAVALALGLSTLVLYWLRFVLTQTLGATSLASVAALARIGRAVLQDEGIVVAVDTSLISSSGVTHLLALRCAAASAAALQLTHALYVTARLDREQVRAQNDLESGTPGTPRTTERTLRTARWVETTHTPLIVPGAARSDSWDDATLDEYEHFKTWRAMRELEQFEQFLDMQSSARSGHRTPSPRASPRAAPRSRSPRVAVRPAFVPPLRLPVHHQVHSGGRGADRRTDASPPDYETVVGSLRPSSAIPGGAPPRWVSECDETGAHIKHTCVHCGFQTSGLPAIQQHSLGCAMRPQSRAGTPVGAHGRRGLSMMRDDDDDDDDEA